MYQHSEQTKINVTSGPHYTSRKTSAAEKGTLLLLKRERWDYQDFCCSVQKSRYLTLSFLNYPEYIKASGAHMQRSRYCTQYSRDMSNSSSSSFPLSRSGRRFVQTGSRTNWTRWIGN